PGPCAAAAPHRSWSILLYSRAPLPSPFGVSDCTPVSLPLTPGYSNAQEPRLFRPIASHCREDVTGLFFIRRLTWGRMQPPAKSRRLAGIHLSQSCAQSRGRGFGCTNIGAIARKTLIEPTRSIPGRPGNSKECWRKSDLVNEKARGASLAKRFPLAREQIFRTLRRWRSRFRAD